MLDTRRFDIPRYLSLLPLFSDLDPSETARLAEGCQLHRFERGAIVFRQGEPCTSFHVVVTGQAKLFVLSPTGQEKVIELIAPGHSFGEALMFLGKPYVVNAQALSDALLMTVSRTVVIEELQRDPRFALRPSSPGSGQGVDPPVDSLPWIDRGREPYVSPARRTGTGSRSKARSGSSRPTSTVAESPCAIASAPTSISPRSWSSLSTSPTRRPRTGQFGCCTWWPGSPITRSRRRRP